MRENKDALRLLGYAGILDLGQDPAERLAVANAVVLHRLPWRDFPALLKTQVVEVVDDLEDQVGPSVVGKAHHRRPHTQEAGDGLIDVGLPRVDCLVPGDVHVQACAKKIPVPLDLLREPIIVAI